MSADLVFIATQAAGVVWTRDPDSGEFARVLRSPVAGLAGVLSEYTIVGTSIVVGDPVDVFDDPNGTTPLSVPFEADEFGAFPGYCAPGSYCIEVDGGDPIMIEICRGDAGLGGPPTGSAGGVLAGTYPNPSFAVDMATQVELDGHVGDSSDAHDASAISFTPDGSISATNLQDAVIEVRDEAVSGPLRITHAWIIGGEIKVPAGTTDSIGAWPASVLSGTTGRIVRVRYFIEGGTSATFKLQLGGVDISGLTALVATTTAATATPTTGPDGDLADLDKVKPIVTAVSGTPFVLTIAMTVEYVS